MAKPETKTDAFIRKLLEQAKTILLSFEPERFHLLETERKKIEYRRHFLPEQTIAFFYVSTPGELVSRIVVFGDREKLSEWSTKDYDEPQSVKDRIADFSIDCRRC